MLKRKLRKAPFCTVDIIIEMNNAIVLIRRKNPPFGWAIPGGFVDYGESLETAAIREAKEETGLDVEELVQFHTYSEPNRDPRFHTISTVYIARAEGIPQADTDAEEVGVFSLEEMKQLNFAFDHKKIIEDYIELRRREKRE